MDRVSTPVALSVVYFMANIEVSENVTEIIKTFESYKEIWQPWFTKVSEDVSFNTPGGQWTTDQVKVLEARGQAPLEIPYIKSEIYLIKSQIIGNVPRFKVIGRTDGDVRKAKLFSTICDYIWYSNSGNDVVDDVVQWQLMTGKSYFHLFWDQDADDGNGGVVLNFLYPYDVLVDPESRRKDEEDADCKFLYRYISRSKAKRDFPQFSEYIDDLKAESEQKFSSGLQDNTDDVKIFDQVMNLEEDSILYLEKQEKITEKFYVVKYDDGGNKVVREFSPEELETFKENLTADDMDIVNAISKIETKYRVKVKRTVILGTMEILSETLPTSHYTIVPVVYESYGNPFAISLTRNLKGLQQETNKRRSLMIAHATASTNLKIGVPKGSIDDMDTFEANWARPDFVYEYDPVLGNPIVHQPVPLPNALYQLESLAKRDLQFIAGVPSVSHGFSDDIGDRTPYKSILAFDEYGSRRTNLIARNLYYAINVVGKVMIDFIQGYMTEPRIIRIINPYDEYDQHLVEIGLNDVFDQPTIQAISDVSVGRYDVQIQVGSMAPTNRYAELELYQNLLQIGAIDRLEFWKKTDIFDKEGLQKRIGEIEQLNSQIQQFTQALEERDKQIGQLTQQVQASAISVERAQADKAFDKKVLDLEAEVNAKMQNLQVAIDELRLQKQTVIAQEKINKSLEKVRISKNTQ